MEMESILDGIVLLDAMGDMDAYQSEIDDISEHSGLPVLERKNLGLEGFKKVILEALDRNKHKHSATNRQPGDA